MRALTHALLLATSLALGGCGYWSRAEVDSFETFSGAAGSPAARPATHPSDVIVTADDIADRPYEVLGDIAVTVNKTLLIEPDPTPAMVDRELRDAAAKLGADAVILVRYGAPGLTVRSWGSLEGKGRAVAFR